MYEMGPGPNWRDREFEEFGPDPYWRGMGPGPGMMGPEPGMMPMYDREFDPELERYGQLNDKNSSAI